MLDQWVISFSRPNPEMKLQVSHAPGGAATLEKETFGYWGFVRHCVGKSCPALSSEPGLISLTAQVVHGSVGLGFVTLVVHLLAAPSEDRRRATFRRFDVRRILEVSS